MATRGTIAIQNTDGSVTGIYTHWDSYISHNGRILEENYATELLVRELIALGDISSLQPLIGEQHPFDTRDLSESEMDPRWAGWVSAYGRDRGETGTEARTCHNWRQFCTENGQEYDYLFTPGAGWQVRTGTLVHCSLKG